MNPLVAIVGRPNVGKSTLFNRLAGRRVALVEDRPGVTRDRHYADAEWANRRFTLIDTGGFIPDEKEPLQKQVRQQAQVAVEECDLVLFVVDGRAGLTAADEDIAEFLRRSGKPLLLVVNKVDQERAAATATADFFRLGKFELWDVSAEHGRGVEEMAERVVALIPPAEEPAAEEDADSSAIRLAIIGRPNVGKSTLVNALLGEERLITSEVAGTTRDAIDTTFEHGGQRFVLTDTAGMRRKSNISQRVEKFSVLASLRAVDRAEVAVLVLDATEPAVDQDAHLAGLAEDKGRALLIVVNKWDRVRGKAKEEEFRAQVKHALRFVSYAPVVFTSALEGKKVEKVLELATMLHRQYHFRAPTPQLNRLLAHVTTEHPAPFSNGKPLRLYYVAQVTAAPPTFRFICNKPEALPPRYKRYLTNQLRETFDLRVPMRLLFHERPGQAKRVAKVARMKGRRARR